MDLKQAGAALDSIIAGFSDRLLELLETEKKGRVPAPRWYITDEELNSLSSLTLKKVNADVGDMATYADANAQLISASKSKVLRHLGRIQETRVEHHRVMILSKHQ